MTTTKARKRTVSQEIETPGEARSRKAKGARTLAVAVYEQEMEILEAAMKRQEELGSRATLSSCLRWAINTVNFDEMPPVY